MKIEDLVPLKRKLIKDKSGQQFGRLLVIEVAGKTKHNDIYYFCKCNCGVEKTIASTHLSSGHTKSCGCLHRELKSTINNLSKTKEYNSWLAMRQRCYYQNNKRYHNYGGRGIKVCDRWRNSFLNFLKDMGKKPSKQHSIDRIDNNGNYEPSNCKWSTAKEQARNKSNNTLWEYNDKIQCIAVWAEETGIDQKILSHRVNEYGWSIKRALTTIINNKG